MLFREKFGGWFGDNLYSLDEICELGIDLIGGKAANLGKMKNAGLPVPDGFCLTTEIYDSYRQTKILPNELIQRIVKIKEQLGGKIAIRSSATCEDGDNLSMAGVFETFYVTDNTQVENSIIKIYDHAQSNEVKAYMALCGIPQDNMKMGIIIQQLIEPEISGVIYTDINNENLLIQYVDGFGSTLVDGKTHGSAMILDRNGSVVESSGFEIRPIPEKTIKQITRLSEIIRNLYNFQPQDIEFAYTKGELHILQSRRLTTDIGKIHLEETPEDCLESTKQKLHQLIEKEKKELGTETGIFSDSNFRELLPKPTEMDFGVFSYIFTGENDIPGAIQLGRIEMGYPLGNESIGFMQYIGGKPFFSIARDAATFYAGFPDTQKQYFSTLVNEYLASIKKNPDRGIYPEMGLYLQDPTEEDLITRYGNKGSDYYKTYQDFVARMDSIATNFIEQFKTKEYQDMTNFISEIKNINLNKLSNEETVNYCINILEHLRTKSCINFVKTARLGFYYSQKLQNLLKQNFNINSDETELLFAKLSQGLDGSEITNVNIAICEAESEDEAIAIGNKLVGHFSTSEMLEIRHKRLKDDSEALHAYVLGIRQSGKYKTDFEKQKEERLKTQETILNKLSFEKKPELEKIITSTQTYMALRETVKYLFIQEYSYLRDALETLEQRLNMEKGDIYFIYPGELSDLIKDPRSMLHLIKSRKQSFANYEKLNLPHVIREEDVENLELLKEKNDDFIEIKGKFLAEGERTEGTIINLDEFDTLERANITIEDYYAHNIPIILVASQMNLGHDPFIAKSSGLILENAGIVSHGAQRARELGKGAIGGIKSSRLKTGTKILFDPLNRLIKKI